jgi:hypothetical protein
MSDTQEELLAEFNAAAGDSAEPATETEDLISEGAELSELADETKAAAGEVSYKQAEAHTLTASARSSGAGSGEKAPPAYNPSNTPAKANTASKSGVSALGVAETVLESGMGIVPLALGILSLFEGSGSTPEPLTKYAMPESIQFTGDTSNSTEQDDFDQMGLPRAYGATPAAAITPNGSETQTGPLQGAAAPAKSAIPTASIQPDPSTQTTAQPGDPQWFMDHSNEIARAVRSAMLNLSSINDVVNDI